MLGWPCCERFFCWFYLSYLLLVECIDYHEKIEILFFLNVKIFISWSRGQAHLVTYESLVLCEPTFYRLSFRNILKCGSKVFQELCNNFDFSDSIFRQRFFEDK